MNTRFWNFKRIALLVVVPLLATLSLAFWMGSLPQAALADVRQGAGTLAENGVLQALTPTLQIHTPVNEAIITQREGTTVTISGFAWNYTPPPFPGVPTLDAIANFEGGGDYYVRWSAAYSATNYVLREADNPEFENSTLPYSGPDTQKFITGKDVGAYYYQVRAYNAEGHPSRWSNVEVVTVTTASTTGFDAQATLPTPQSIALQEVTATEPFTVEVRINAGEWQTATATQDAGGWWNWHYDWTLPQEDDALYTIQARAQDSTGTGEMDTITVTIRNAVFYSYLPIIYKRWPPIPYPPTLHEIENTDGDGNYTVSWEYGTYPGVPDPTSFTLQEASDTGFTAPTEWNLSGSTFSKAFTDKPSGTHYYRVRGSNSYGAGEWSNVRSVAVQGFYDNFSDNSTGWPRATYKHSDGVELMNMDYADSTYRMKVLLNAHNRNNHKMGVAKAPLTNSFSNYDASVDHHFRKASDQGEYPPDEGKAALIFGANNDFSTIYVFEWNYNGNCAVTRYRDVTVPVSGYDGFGGNAKTDAIMGWRNCADFGLQAGYDKTNHALVEVRDNHATVYIVSGAVKHKVHEFTDDQLRSHRQVGLVTGSWLWTPVESRFDNFRLDSH